MRNCWPSNPVVFTINCSGQSLKDGAFTEFLCAEIAASGINPEALCFELTESAAIGNLGPRRDADAPAAQARLRHRAR